MERVSLKIERQSVTLGGDYGDEVYSGWWVWPADMAMVAAGLEGLLFGPFDTKAEAEAAEVQIVIEDGTLQ